MAGRIAYYGNIVKDGLVFDLDAAKRDSYPGSGTVWRDVSGFQNNGTLVNGATFNSENGGSIVLDGTDDYIDITNSSSIDFGSSSSFTMEIMVKKTSNPPTGNVSGLFCKRLNNIRYGIDDYYGLNSPRVGIYNNVDGQKVTFLNNSSTLSLYTDIVFTYEPNSTNGIKLWVNGVLINTLTTVGLSDFSSSNSYQIGSTYALGGTINYFFGSIVTAKIYNRTLSASEVLQNYNALKGRLGL